MTSQKTKGDRAPRRRLDGGYEPISVTQLAMVWWAYRAGVIRKVELRVWFACWEMEIRRRLSDGKHVPSIEQLQALVGQGGLRGAVRRLKAVGLLRACSREGIEFAQSPDELRVEDLAGLWEMLDELPNPGRRVPVPRRMLRRLAGGLSKARTATVLAHLIRCLYYRKGQGINPVGCCKASWVARVFGVTERSVYDARKYLVEVLGWLAPRDCAQHVLNRDGLWVTINLSWGSDPAPAEVEAKVETDVETEPKAGEGSEAPETRPVEFSPPPPENPARFSGPKEDKKPLRENENQKPASGGPAGVQISKSEENPPKLSDVVPEDLRNLDRLLTLFDQAIARGLIGSSEADRLRFVAAAVHAQAVGSNPCRLFAWLVAGGHWEVITQADEDEAHARLKRWQREKTPPPVARPPRRASLSDDAHIVRRLRDLLRTRGVHVDPFAAAQHALPGWDRARWDRAAAEVDATLRGEPASAFSTLSAVLGGLGAE